jgi:hypothetical protein
MAAATWVKVAGTDTCQTLPSTPGTVPVARAPIIATAAPRLSTSKASRSDGWRLSAPLNCNAPSKEGALTCEGSTGSHHPPPSPTRPLGVPKAEPLAVNAGARRCAVRSRCRVSVHPTWMHSTPGRSPKRALRSPVRTTRPVEAAVAAMIKSCAPRLAPSRCTCASKRPCSSAVLRSYGSTGNVSSTRTRNSLRPALRASLASSTPVRSSATVIAAIARSSSASIAAVRVP